MGCVIVTLFATKRKGPETRFTHENPLEFNSILRTGGHYSNNRFSSVIKEAASDCFNHLNKFFHFLKIPLSY